MSSSIPRPGSIAAYWRQTEIAKLGRRSYAEKLVADEAKTKKKQAIKSKSESANPYQAKKTAARRRKYLETIPIRNSTPRHVPPLPGPGQDLENSYWIALG
jgi:hypothetical protein